MIVAAPYAGKRVAVFGLGHTGLACVRALLGAGAEVFAWDDAEASRIAAQEKEIALADLSELDWSTVDALMLSPGVPLTHPEPHWTVKKAHQAGVGIVGDTEIFVRTLNESGCNAKLVAITGSLKNLE